ELRGFIEALKLVKQCYEHTAKTRYSIVGDSEYIMGAMKRGILGTITPERSDQVNWEEWHTIKTLWNSLHPSIVVETRWIPRDLNQAADRFCNDTLDGLLPNVEFAWKHPPVPMSFASSEEWCHAAYDFVAQRKRVSCRTLSPFLYTPWRVIFYNNLRLICGNPENIDNWLALLLMPKVLLFPQSKQKQKSFLSTNSAAMRYMETLIETVSAAAHRGGCTMTKRSTNEERIVSLVAQNRVARACDLLGGSDLAVQTPGYDKVLNAWPRREDDIFRFDSETPSCANFGELDAAVRSFAAGKSPDPMGWTKELLRPLFEDIDDSQRQLLQDFFNRIANRQLPRLVDVLLSLDSGCFLGTEQKSRPIVNTNIFRKVLWKVALKREAKHFPPLNPVAMSTLIQQLVAAGWGCLRLDGANAFQRIRRAVVFEAIQECRDPLFRAMWNATYGVRSTILVYDAEGALVSTVESTTGVRAGCVSASKLFTIGMQRFSRCGMFQYVDDLFQFIHPQRTFDAEKAELVTLLQPTGVDFFGPKTRQIGGAGGDLQPFVALGAVATANVRDMDAINGLFERKLRPTLNTIAKLATVKLPVQVKLFMLRALELRCRFVIESTIVAQCRMWSQTCDKVIRDVLAEIFELHHMPEAHRALISLPVGKGGLGCAQLDVRFEWAQNRSRAAYMEALKFWWLSSRGFGTNCPDALALPVLPVDMTMLVMSADDAVQKVHENMPHHRIVSCMVKQRYCPQRHLLLEVPAAPFVISDNACRSLVWSRLAYLPPTVKCPCDFDETQETRYQHFVRCSSCRQGTVRHNTVLYELGRSIPKLGICTQVNPNTLPLPVPEGTVLRPQQGEHWFERAVTGPDLLLNVMPTQCLDLTIVNPISGVRVDGDRVYVMDVMARAKNMKEQTYAQWHAYYEQFDHGITCAPFIMTSNGFFSHDTLAWMKKLTDDRREARWWPSFLQLNVQKVLAEAAAVIFLSRSSQRTASIKFLSQQPARANNDLHAAGSRSQRTNVTGVSCVSFSQPGEMRSPATHRITPSNSLNFQETPISVSASQDQRHVENEIPGTHPTLHQ
ncbi:MAG: hypothetical protein FD121_1614, partial [Gallionellaceae bacterium]